MDGGFWDLDVSTPVTMDGVARPAPPEGAVLPLGLSRGTRLSRPKQIDFMQRFMSAPFVPSYSGHPSNGGNGLSLQRVLTFSFGENWFTTLLGQFNVQKFVSSIRENGLLQLSDSSWLQSIRRHLGNKSLYALGYCSELLVTPDDTVLLGLEAYGDNKTPRKKVVFHHKFPNHNLTAEAVWPGLYVDKLGTYWELPLSMAVDIASVCSDSGASYHLCIHNNAGSPKSFETNGQNHGVPAALLPGLCVKSAFSFKKNIDIWRSNAQKLRMVQPYDIFSSSPHILASAIIGAVASASIGDNAVDVSQGFRGSFQGRGVKSAFLADMFASVSFSAQYGNFQRLFLDLTRFYGRLDFPSASKILSGSTRLAQDMYNNQQPDLEAVQAICPNASFSLQQQIGGPFSFRVDSQVRVDLKNREWPICVDEPIFAMEYALQVLGSAKAIAWYSPKHQEFMVELRFFET